MGREKPRSGLMFIEKNGNNMRPRRGRTITTPIIYKHKIPL
ncbi:MAG: hypothetical protein RJA25_2243, partial [Bacteroidota bacterium]